LRRVDGGSVIGAWPWECRKEGERTYGMTQEEDSHQEKSMVVQKRIASVTFKENKQQTDNQSNKKETRSGEKRTKKEDLTGLLKGPRDYKGGKRRFNQRTKVH